MNIDIINTDLITAVTVYVSNIHDNLNVKWIGFYFK